MLEYLFKEMIEDTKIRPAGNELLKHLKRIERKELKVLIDYLKTMTDDWEKVIIVYYRWGRSTRINIQNDNYYEIANFNFIEEEEILRKLNKAFGKEK